MSATNFGAIDVDIGTTLQSPGGTIELIGTSYDFGVFETGTLILAGDLVIAAGASFSGDVTLGAQELLDFAGSLGVGRLVLGPGAVMAGDGALVTGSITGTGTLAVAGGGTLEVAAGSVAAGAGLDVGGGGVLVLGSGSIDGTLGFIGGSAAAPVTGGYADSWAAGGGVIVIEDPQSLSGSITGFMPGDRLIFPGLTSLAIAGLSSGSFEVTGRDSANASAEYRINAAIPAGTALLAGADAQGDGEVLLRGAGFEVAVDGSAPGAGSIAASAGIPQPILGLQILPQNAAPQSLTVTLGVGGGVLADGSLAASSQLVLAAPGLAALDQALAALSYTANATTTQDALTLSSGTGPLAGLSATVPISIRSAGTIAGFAELPASGQTALFAGTLALETLPAAPGAIIVTGAAEFDDVLAINGISGTSLLIDAGGTGVFGMASAVTLGSDVTVGDAGGAGTLGIVTTEFQAGADLVVAGSTAAAGSVVEVTGALSVGDTLVVGAQASGRLDLGGDLGAAATSIDSAGLVIASGGAAASFGRLVDAGTLMLQNDAQATAANLILTGALQLTGQSGLTGLSSAVIGGQGRLDVGPGTDFSAGGLNAVSGAVLVAGSLAVAGNLVSDTGVTLAGGTVAAAIATLGSGGVLSGHGEVMLTGSGAKLAVPGGGITASGGTLVLDGNVTMSSAASLAIAANAALVLQGGAAGGPVVFAGADASLIIGDLAADAAGVSGMVGHDVIDLPGVAPSLVTYSGGMITARNGSGQLIGSFALSPAGGQPAVAVIADGGGGALITLGEEMACFARGTRLLTPNGYVPVEAFKPGDPIITEAGAKHAVRWIGRRIIDMGPATPTAVLPVVVTRGALAPGCPSRDIRLSPSHAIFLDGVLVPVMHLVNGATILSDARTGAITYYHIELDRHAVLIADGLPVESYLDTGNRGQFQHQTGVRGQAAERRAPLVTGGPRLARIRRRLHEVALRAGFSLTREPDLRAVAGDLTLWPEYLQGARTAARFILPPDARQLMLLARSAAPAETDPETDDRRQLGICVRAPGARRERLRLGAGWYRKAAGDAGIWMGGRGEVLLPAAATEFTLTLVAVAQRWQTPPAD